jgi:Ca-activated chloride channel homolog
MRTWLSLPDLFSERHLSQAMINLKQLVWWPFGTASAQRKHSDSDAPRLRPDANLVLLHTLVTDCEGNAVAGLKPDHFDVRADHVPQSICLFRGEDAPVAVGIVVDHSSSMACKRAEVVAAVLELARASNPQDQMFVVNFNDAAELGLPSNRPFTSDLSALDVALSRVVISGMPALCDALPVALDHLQMAEFGVKVVILISDGGHDCSSTSLDTVLEGAVQSGAVVYAIGLFADQDPNTNILQKLADTTGGKAYFPVHIDEVHRICQEIARDIRSRYTLGFLPAHPANENGFHSLQVGAHRQVHDRLEVRARSGYFGKALNPNS